MCDVPSIAVFCSESIECFPGIVSNFFLKLLFTIPVAPLLLLLLVVVVVVIVVVVLCGASGKLVLVRCVYVHQVNLVEEFDILQIVGEGWFGKILLAEHRATDTEMVLKALPKPYTAIRDFYREFHYSLHLGAHRNIITTYDLAFETAGFYVFSQEYAPLGDLTSNVSETGIGELHSKRVTKQVRRSTSLSDNEEIVQEWRGTL